jgi:uncharacterized lipoprotein NlpE involved in copper resistance
MPPGNNANTIASQREYLRDKLEETFLLSSVFWSRVQARTDIKPVSSRPSRIPFTPIPTAAFRQFNPNGGSLGVGDGPQEVYGQLSCVYFSQGGAYTAQSDYATEGDSRSIKDYVAYTEETVTRTFAGMMDAVLCTGDGANTLDTVVTAGANYLVVNNADFFQSGQPIDIYSALTGAAGFVGTVTIQTVDTTNTTLWLTGPVPGGVTGGYYLLVSGSAGVPNSGLFGRNYYQVAGNTGNFMNILRSTYPDQFSARNIPANGALVPATVRAMLAQIILAKGIEAADENDLIVHCNVDMAAAWEDNALLVQRIDIGSGKRKESADMLAGKTPSAMAGYEMVVNPRAIPGLIDFFALKQWGRLEAKALDMYEVDGQTTFPQYAADGSVATTNMFWMIMGVQVGSWMPRINAFINNVTIPRGYFGK